MFYLVQSNKLSIHLNYKSFFFPADIFKMETFVSIAGGGGVSVTLNNSANKLTERNTPKILLLGREQNVFYMTGTKIC